MLIQGGPSLVPVVPWVSGVRYDSTSAFGGTLGTQAFLANTLLAIPLIPGSPSARSSVSVALDRIGIEVTTGAAAGKKARLGLYAMGSDGKPGALIVDGGEVAADGIAAVEATISASVRSGVMIFAAVVSDGTPTLRSISGSGFRVGMSSATDTSTRLGYSTTLTYTAGVTTLPSTFPASPSLSSLVSRIFVRAA